MQKLMMIPPQARGRSRGRRVRRLASPGRAAWIAALALAAAGLASAGVAYSATYEITPGEPNLVRFESKAPLESFEGRTRVVRGTLSLNPQNLADSIEMTIEVDLKSLDTGIPLRNQHMQKNHLHIGRFPQATFHARRLREPSALALAPGQKISVQVLGDFSLHGVTRPMEVPAEVEALGESDGAALRIVARFDVLLSDHQIPRPQFLALKLDDRQRVTVELLARPQREAN